MSTLSPSPLRRGYVIFRKIRLRMTLVTALAVSAIMIASMPAEAASTNEIIYHSNQNIAGEVWFNSGYSAIHEGNPQFGENSFTVKDRFCGDGWGVGVEWVLNGNTYSKKSEGDCNPVEVTFEAASAQQQPIATEFDWRAFKWDTNHISDSTYEPWRKDWMGSDKGCNSIWMGRAATYGFIASGVGHTFEVSIWPTRTARLAPTGKSTTLIWEDLQRCTPLPPSLTQSQRESMYKQLLCHARFGITPRLGGPTWDLEADRENISWALVNAGYGKCNW